VTEVERSETTEAESAGRLAELYVRHAPGGLRLAYLLTGDRNLAEDLLQDGFVRVVSRLRHLRQPDAFDAYLRRTIVNLSRNAHRRRALERGHLEIERRQPIPESREPDIVLELDMRRALLALPERQRAAVVLRFYEDLPEGEIAEILRCRPSTVRSLVFRAIRSLHDDLGEQPHA
jgi:RNA polymerase sigma-70 factor (sigma-E family)